MKMRKSFTPNWTKVRVILSYSIVSKIPTSLQSMTRQFVFTLKKKITKKFTCDGEDECCRSHENLLCKILRNQIMKLINVL